MHRKGSLTPRLLDDIATYRLHGDPVSEAELREQGDAQTRHIRLVPEPVPLCQDLDRGV